MERVVLLGVGVDSVTMEEAVEVIDGYVRAGGGIKLVFTVNVDHLMLAGEDAELSEATAGADLRVPDGMPLVWASRLLGFGMRERVTGIDLVYEICKLSVRRSYSLFLLGGAEGVAEEAARKLAGIYPGLRVAGFHSPSFSMDENEDESILRRINSAAPDILLVGLGAPKQEKWLHRYRGRLEAKVGLAVGGSFDIISGGKKRAPKCVQKAGFEWLYRLVQEPGRLWRRYLIRDIKFPLLIFRELVLSSTSKKRPR